MAWGWLQYGPMNASKLPVETCDDMQAVRRHIDAIDSVLVPLLAQRQGYVAQAARLKQDLADVVDEERIEFIIARVRKMAAEQGLSPDVAERTWRAMIAGYIDFEHQEFKRLRHMD